MDTGMEYGMDCLILILLGCQKCKQYADTGYTIIKKSFKFCIGDYYYYIIIWTTTVKREKLLETKSKNQSKIFTMNDSDEALGGP